MFYLVTLDGVAAMQKAMPAKKLHAKNPKNYPHLTARPQKTNPFGSTGEPAVARMMAGVHWRSRVRDVIRTRQGADSLHDDLAKFAPSLVRGDFVPTIADAYADMLRIVNGGSL